MTDNQNNPIATPASQQEPLIPPSYLLTIGVIGILVAIVVAITQPEFGAIGFGGLGLGILSFIAWMLLAPQQAFGLLTGRTARFGGLSIVVTVLLLAAFVFAYIFARNAELRIDLTESDQFSLTEESRQAIAAFGADPSIPRVRILAFYNTSQGGQRDRDQLLFEDYAAASGGKIEYQAYDLDRSLPIANLYGVTRGGQIAVVVDNPSLVGQPQTLTTPDGVTGDNPFSLGAIQPDETGFTADIQNVELLESSLQQDLTNAILKVAASGNFAAYFLNVQDGEAEQMTVIQQALVSQFDWTVETISLVDLTAPESEFRLNDESRDGQVLVIPGGSRAFTAEELAVIQDYLNGGGDLVLMAGTNFNEQAAALATDAALNDYLFSTFGIRINNDVVMDEVQAYQNPLRPGSTDLDLASFITTTGLDPAQGAVIFDVPHSLTLADPAPANVILTPLARSSSASYARTDIAAMLTAEDLSRPADAVQQQYVLAATAENTTTGAKLIVFGSTSPALDAYALTNFDNITVAFNSLVWATNFNDFFQQITIQQVTRPQDLPITVTQQTLRDVNLLTVFVLPFGVLAIGAYVWWTNRERRKA
ncbi:MAG: Gldg family protein [bacterium]|nr:Gldg family protein [bacterium]